MEISRPIAERTKAKNDSVRRNQCAEVNLWATSSLHPDGTRGGGQEGKDPRKDQRHNLKQLHGSRDGSLKHDIGDEESGSLRQFRSEGENDACRIFEDCGCLGNGIDNGGHKNYVEELDVKAEWRVKSRPK